MNSVSDTSINLNQFKLDKLYYNYSSMKYNNFPNDTEILLKIYISGTPLIPMKCLFANFETEDNSKRIEIWLKTEWDSFR